MPHVIAEYSANIEDKIRIEALLEVLHDAMMATGVAELAGLRTRAERRDRFRIADNDPANGFVNITVRMAQGRPLEARKLVAQTVFDAAFRHLERVFATTPFVLSGRGAGDRSGAATASQQHPHLDEGARDGGLTCAWSMFRSV